MNSFLETRSYESDFPLTAFYAIDNGFLAHWHIDVEMVLVCEGSIRVGRNKESAVLTQGEMAIFSSADIHYYDSRNMHSIIIVIIFRPELVDSPGGWPEDLCFTTAFMNLDNLDKSAGKNILEIFHSIADEMKESIPLSCLEGSGRILSRTNQLNKKSPYYQLYVKGKILELCALVLRHFPTYAINSTESKSKLPDIQGIQFAIKYLDNSYMHDITLYDIAKKSNLSPYYFSRLFSKFTGMCFKEYLNRIRVAKAEQLIKTTQKSILDISLDCGFNSIRTFNRTFKAVKGFSPSKIRGAMDE